MYSYMCLKSRFSLPWNKKREKKEQTHSFTDIHNLSETSLSIDLNGRNDEFQLSRVVTHLFWSKSVRKGVRICTWLMKVKASSRKRLGGSILMIGLHLSEIYRKRGNIGQFAIVPLGECF